jgi:hypothetical protein
MNDKPRLQRLTADDASVLVDAMNDGDLDVPHVIAGKNGGYWADADELRRWRKLRESQNDAEVKR